MPDQVTTECPPLAELEKLLRGRCTDARNACLCEHVGSCPECQKRLDKLAGSASDLATHLREAEQEPPPKDSAYWRAMASAEEELRKTSLFPSNGEADTPHPEGDLNLDFLQPPDKPNRLGKLGSFDVVRIVGRGGMGVVLHGYDPSLDRDIAIKVIDPQLANNEVARQRFCREARAAAAVTHDNLVAVHQVNEDEPSGLPYLVMQLVNGESLEQRLKRVGKLSVPEVAKLGMQAAAGLAAAHAGGLIHRDIKPANILLEAPSDRVKLTDFGLARAAEDVKLTRTGFVAGSPLYMAPEQARGDEVDPRADLFSLGTVLYEATTGTAPFEAKTPLAVAPRKWPRSSPPGWRRCTCFRRWTCLRKSAPRAGPSFSAPRSAGRRWGARCGRGPAGPSSAGSSWACSGPSPAPSTRRHRSRSNRRNPLHNNRLPTPARRRSSPSRASPARCGRSRSSAATAS